MARRAVRGFSPEQSPWRGDPALARPSVTDALCHLKTIARLSAGDFNPVIVHNLAELKPKVVMCCNQFLKNLPSEGGYFPSRLVVNPPPTMMPPFREIGCAVAGAPASD